MNRNVLNTILGTAVVVAGVSFSGCTDAGTGGEGEGETAEGEGEEGEGEEGEGEEGEGEEGEGEAPVNIDPANATVGTVRLVINNFVGRAVANNVYNAWFSNGDLVPLQLTNCLVHQVSAVLGVPNARYTGATTVSQLNNLYDANDDTEFTCQSMTASHTGLGIPTYANAALINDVVAAIDFVVEDDATRDSITATIAAAVTGADFVDSIVDETQDVPATQNFYNPIGGKPAVLALLAGTDCDPATAGDQLCFLGRVLGDPTLLPSFAGADAPRLTACLQRQLAGALGGPDAYANANGLVEPEIMGAAGSGVQCLDMVAAHVGDGVTDAQFEALDVHAATALTLLLGSPAAGTRFADVITAAVAVLTSPAICADIVEQPGEAVACAEFDPANEPDAP